MPVGVVVAARGPPLMAKSRNGATGVTAPESNALIGNDGKQKEPKTSWYGSVPSLGGTGVRRRSTVDGLCDCDGDDEDGSDGDGMTGAASKSPMGEGSNLLCVVRLYRFRDVTRPLVREFNTSNTSKTLPWASAQVGPCRNGRGPTRVASLQWPPHTSPPDNTTKQQKGRGMVRW